MESIGIKLADGSFYPILEDGKPEKKNLALTTVKDNQTTVHVDLYRSKSGSMDDAEYVDTLEITNMNPHGNGEPSLTLDIELDADNKLNARINDPETGLESVKNVSLVSRTPEERSMPANFNLEPTEEDAKPFEEIFNEPKKESPEDKDMSFEEILNSISDPKDEETDSNPFAITKQDVEDLDKIDTPETEESEVLGPAPNSEDFAFDDIAASKKDDNSFDLANFVSPEEEAPVKKELKEEPETVLEEPAAEEAVLDLPDFEEPVVEEAPAVTDETIAEETIEAEQPALEEPAVEEVALDLPDFDAPQEEANTTEESNTATTANEDFELPEAFKTTAEETQVETPAEDKFPDDTFKNPFDLSGFDQPESEEVATASEETTVEEAPAVEEPSEMPSIDETVSDELTSFEEPVSNETNETIDRTLPEETAFDLPDFAEDTATSNDTALDLPDFAEDTNKNNDAALDLPDFGNIDNQNDSIFELPDFNDTTNANERIVEPLGFDSKEDFPAFELPDFEEDADNTDFTVPNFDEEETNTDFVLPNLDKDEPAITPQNMFSDLYDKETLEGKSSSGYDDYSESKRQSKVPVVICLVCALICLMSLLLLFVLPTNMNLITRAQAIAQKTEKTNKEDSTDTETNAIASNETTAETVTTPAIAETSAKQETKPEKDTAPAKEPAVVKEPVTAKENEIVIATIPSQVVPEKPAKPATKLPDTKYTVVWGDTLWDISNAYYKNPWRYTYLAEYNHLKNPNYIKAGSVILIPAE